MNSSTKSRHKRRKAYLSEVRRQCRLANKADRRDGWAKYVYLSGERGA